MFMLIKRNLHTYNKFNTGKTNSSKTRSGFTLVELLITMAILGILAMIIIPSYNAQIRKSSRSDAVTGLTRAAQDLERCHSDTLTYNDATCTDYTGGVLTERQLYTITAADLGDVAAQNAQSFTLRADPVAGTTQANDDQCIVFTLDHTGLRVAQNSNGDDTTEACWR